MTSSKDTILVLMDKTEYLLQQGIRAVKSAQAVDQIVPPMKLKRKVMSNNMEKRGASKMKVIKVSTKAKILPTIPEQVDTVNQSD